MAKSLNKVMLIGNLTRDPELKYTPSGAAVCTFGVATNRDWKSETGEKKEDVEFHNIVAWSKLAEICAQLLKKGRKVYVEGRLTTHTWQAQDGTQKNRTEVVINDMVILDKKIDEVGVGSDIDIPEPVVAEKKNPETSSGQKTKKEVKTESVEEPGEEDIPF